MPIPYTPTYFETTAYNTSYAIVSDILGMGDDGYGLANFGARVVTTSTKIKAVSITDRGGYAGIAFAVTCDISTAVARSSRTYLIDVDAKNHVRIN